MAKWALSFVQLISSICHWGAMEKIKKDVATMAKFFLFLPLIAVSLLKMAIRVRREMGHPNPDMWE